MIFTCPHCNEEIIIQSVNCGIFRHCVYKDGSDFNPHAPKELCEKVVKDKLVYGCAGPFKLVNGKAVKCDYI